MQRTDDNQPATPLLTTMTWDYYDQTLDDVIDYNEPRETRLQTANYHATSKLQEPIYLGRHDTDNGSIAALTDDPDELTTVHAGITYDERIDAITVTAHDEITVIRHGTNDDPSPHVTYIRPSSPRLGLTTNQTTHAIQRRRPNHIIRGTTRITHPEHGHELSLCNEAAYQAMKRYHDADYHFDTASPEPRVDATAKHDQIRFTYQDN